jgi:uncharacterized lipoprotein YddW (UPF0748 family)
MASEPLAVERVPVAREFRAAWVATVGNIDWPSQKGLSTEQQKQEALEILDFLAQNNFNAVILQVRPQCDAFYISPHEPWSHFLTGRQGQPPHPFYDPLRFWIEQAHDRGLELHAWFNPYRAHSETQLPPPDTSIAKRRPDLVKQLENGFYWLNPAKQETQDYSFNVVMDVLGRYDIDGVHFDDYFYPYPEYNAGKDFPDEDTWQAYRAAGGELARGDWRRQAVNDFVQRVYFAVKHEKPHVKFGISPFGIWRPGHPESIRGFDQYNQLYADAKLWLNQGWVDYWTPQLYWPISQQAQSFPVLLGWWSQQNLQRRHLWPGINVKHGAEECINQVMITRGLFSQTDSGGVFWNTGRLRANGGQIGRQFADGIYSTQALVPPSPWLDSLPPARPQVSRQGNRILFSSVNQADVFRWIVSIQIGSQWQHTILNRNEASFALPKQAVHFAAVYAVDRTGNISLPATVAVR